MRRATTAARNLAGLENRDRDVGIPTIAWPPEPSDSAAGMLIFFLSISMGMYITFNTNLIITHMFNYKYIIFIFELLDEILLVLML